MNKTDAEHAVLREPEEKIRARHNENTKTYVEDIPSGHFIAGEWFTSETNEHIQILDPTTQEKLHSVEAGSPQTVNTAVRAADGAYKDRWKHAAPQTRRELLNTFADQLEANKESLATVLTLENGKAIQYARGEISASAQFFRYYAGLAEHIPGDTLRKNDGLSVRTIREPYGVVGQIIPWNAPLMLATWKIAPALAAGNVVVLKPSEETPLSMMKFIRLVEDYIPEGVVNVVNGYGKDVGAALTGHSQVRKVAFTGSRPVGEEVMKNSARHITDVTLELGGKSPLIIFPDADLQVAVRTTIKSIYPNTGETCTAGSRVFVHEDVKERYLAQLRKEVSEIVLGDPLREEVEMGPKVSPEQLERTKRYVEMARESGANILYGGREPDDSSLTLGCNYLPTIISNLSHNHECSREEIFGPVQIIYEWSRYEDMVERANDTRFGLAAGIVTQDIDQANGTAEDLEAGTVWINTYNEFFPGQPFGGYKESGIGRETAYQTLYQYTQCKSITRRSGQV